MWLRINSVKKIKNKNWYCRWLMLRKCVPCARQPWISMKCTKFWTHCSMDPFWNCFHNLRLQHHKHKLTASFESLISLTIGCFVVHWRLLFSDFIQNLNRLWEDYICFSTYKSVHIYIGRLILILNPVQSLQFAHQDSYIFSF